MSLGIAEPKCNEREISKVKEDWDAKSKSIPTETHFEKMKALLEGMVVAVIDKFQGDMLILCAAVWAEAVDGLATTMER